MNPVELVEYAYKIRDEQKLEWLTLCIPHRARSVRRSRVEVFHGCRGQVIGSHVAERAGVLCKELIVSVQIAELLKAAAKLVDHFERVAVLQAEEGRDAEAEETMRQHVALKRLLHDIPTTKGRAARKPRKPRTAKEDARGG